MHSSWGQVYYTSPYTVSCHGFPNCLSVLMSMEGGYNKNYERLKKMTLNISGFLEIFVIGPESSF
jgi:hypothetical protein